MTTKERPILFSGPMVRAILEGRKTQTRRVVKHQPIKGDVYPTKDDGIWGAQTERSVTSYFACPHGQPGDRLWVRETWGLLDTQPCDGPERATIGYRADGDGNAPNGRYQLWRPSIFMPRWASRLTLEILRIRVERLQDITEDDCIDEGVPHDGLVGYYCEEGDPNDPEDIGAHRCNWRAGYKQLWDSLNAARGHGWDKNPWVWVIEFKRIKP